MRVSTIRAPLGAIATVMALVLGATATAPASDAATARSTLALRSDPCSEAQAGLASIENTQNDLLGAIALMEWENEQMQEQLDFPMFPLEQWEIDLLEEAIFLNNVMIWAHGWEWQALEIDRAYLAFWINNNC